MDTVPGHDLPCPVAWSWAPSGGGSLPGSLCLRPSILRGQGRTKGSVEVPAEWKLEVVIVIAFISSPVITPVDQDVICVEANLYRRELLQSAEVYGAELDADPAATRGGMKRISWPGAA